MANTTIKTRILLRNDTLANWTGSTLVLGKGEVAIATGLDGNLVEVRVGNGTTTWSGAAKLAVDASQISGIVELIQGTAKKYQVVANGEDGNSWKLQEAALSGGDWTDVSGSAWTVDFTAINNAITGLTADVSYLSGQIDATNTTLNTVSSDYLKATNFAALSNEIGLSAASASNPVVTKNDIGDLAGAMHFRGAVSDPSDIADPKAGDVVIVASTSKEYVYNGTAWIELGDEALYATKAEVATIFAGLTSDIAELTANDQYLSGQITSITSTYATKAEVSAYALSADVDTFVATVSAATVTSANSYTDTKIGALDVAANEAGNENAGFVTVVTETDGKVAVTKKEIQLSDITDVANISANIGLSNYALKTEAAEMSAYAYGEASSYTNSEIAKLSVDRFALSADVDTLVSQTSAAVVGQSTDTSASNTIYGAKKYADDKVTELSSGFLILDCGASTLRTDEPAYPTA